MSLFYITHGPAGDSAITYTGLDQTTAEKLIAERGFTFDFVDEAAYNVFVGAHPHAPLLAPDLTQAKATLKDKNAKIDDRMDALVSILGL